MISLSHLVNEHSIMGLVCGTKEGRIDPQPVRKEGLPSSYDSFRSIDHISVVAYATFGSQATVSTRARNRS